jgi:hypothetical protein
MPTCPSVFGNKLLLWCLVAAGLGLTACGRKEPKAPAPSPSDEAAAQAPVQTAPPPVNPADSAAEQEKARIAQALAMRARVEPPKPALQLRGGELATPEVLAAYNQELARLIFKNRDAPETLEELVRKWPMPRLPTPPPGKRIVYDPVNRIIRLDPP